MQNMPPFSRYRNTDCSWKANSIPHQGGRQPCVFFHDCFIDGCDASVLVKSSASNTAEMDADINHSLAGDAFDIVSRIKIALELSCLCSVSCADMLTVVAQNLITMTDGPHYKARLGCKDGLFHRLPLSNENQARVSQTIDQMIAKFASPRNGGINWGWPYHMIQPPQWIQ